MRKRKCPYFPFCVTIIVTIRGGRLSKTFLFIFQFIIMAERRTCKGCQEVYHIASFFRHVAYTKTCKEAYGEEWPKMLKEKKKLANKRSYEKNKEKLKSKYQEKKEVLKAKHLEKKDEINKCRREKCKNEKAEKYAREDKRIRERPGEKVRQHVRILRGRAKKMNNCCYERFPEVWMAKLKQIKKDNDPNSTKKITKKLKNQLKATEDIFKSVKEEIEHEIQKIFDQLEEKPSLISTYYLKPKKLDQLFDYDVFPKWLELFKSMKKKLSRFMKCNGEESIYYCWSDKTKKYEYWDEESEMLESFEKHLRNGVMPSHDSSDTDSSPSESDDDTTWDDNDEDDSDDSEPKFERGPKQCEGCNKTFQFETFLKHVTHKESCKEKYGEERIQDMKQLCRSATWKKYNKKDKDKVKMISDDRISLTIGCLKVCEGCKESFLEERFFRHVSHTKKCLSAYGTEKWNEMLQARKQCIEKRKARKKSAKLLSLKNTILENEMKKPSHEKFVNELQEFKKSTIIELSGDTGMLIETIKGGIYYFRKVNSMIAKPNSQISDLLKQLESDAQDFTDLRDQLYQRFTELTDAIHKLPGFDTFVNGDDGHKDIQKKHIDFVTKARKQVSELKNIVGNRFEALENLLDLEKSIWYERYEEYRFNAMGAIGDNRVLQSAEFKKCCKKASMLNESTSKRMVTDPPRKQSDKMNAIEDSPKIIQKPFFHKRKKIDFKMSDLENAAEDENDSDFVE